MSLVYFTLSFVAKQSNGSHVTHHPRTVLLLLNPISLNFNNNMNYAAMMPYGTLALGVQHGMTMYNHGQESVTSVLGKVLKTKLSKIRRNKDGERSGINESSRKPPSEEQSSRVMALQVMSTSVTRDPLIFPRF